LIKKLHPKRQKEPRKTTEETSGDQKIMKSSSRRKEIAKVSGYVN
jgi:hypothetical protein